MLDLRSGDLLVNTTLSLPYYLTVLRASAKGGIQDFLSKSQKRQHNKSEPRKKINKPATSGDEH